MEGETVLEKAKDWCVRAHEGQTRDDGRPYSTHPMAVADILQEQGITDVATLAAAYLHDVVEDTSVTAEQIREAFGEEIASLVEELTNPNFPGRTFEEKHRTLAEHARKMTDKAKAIKLADRLHNLTEMQEWSMERQQRYARATVDLLQALEPWPLPELGNRIQALIQTYLD